MDSNIYFNAKDTHGWTLFMKKIDLIAIDNGGWTLFLKYIDLNYIYLNALDNGGWTTFMLANGYGQQDVVKCLPDHLSETIRKLIWMSETIADELYFKADFHYGRLWWRVKLTLFFSTAHKFSLIRRMH